MLAKVRDRNVITIPSEIIKAVGIKPWDDVKIIRIPRVYSFSPCFAYSQ